ncbi:hypothetical protein [Thalassobacillus sp. C254]|uniref:hypothetical protein n=1 Tax=Thalassobacillus sp. C254 TaxID=1225341 RepID=UPI0006D28839|nr:hypothetical protein [Thalassobacillus sp. C254]
MSEYTVKRKFRDKHTKEIHLPDSIYKASDQRAAELRQKGILDEKVKQEETTESEIEEFLDQKVENVISDTEGLGAEKYKKLLELEKEGKKRKTVIEHFQTQVEAIGEENEHSKS